LIEQGLTSPPTCACTKLPKEEIHGKSTQET